MNSVLNEILQLRQGKSIQVDYLNSNRYRVVINEYDGSKTAYCFTAPIYNEKTRKIADLKFRKQDNFIYFDGTNSKIIIENHIKIENSDGYCNFLCNKTVSEFSETYIQLLDDLILPTTNGIAYKANCKNGSAFVFNLEIDKPFLDVRSNDKYFCLMSDRFKPFVSVACIGTENEKEEIVAPAKISYQKLTDKLYQLTIIPGSKNCEYVFFEINLYEGKLVQDTTVESNNPKINNAFGSTAYLGNTVEFGEQWLYSKLDYSKVNDLMYKHINRAILHMPKHNSTNLDLVCYRVSARFCSFGSNWNNKIPAANPVSNSFASENYQSIDITEIITNPNTKFLVPTDGFILKPKNKGSEFSVVSTGDSYYSPQILEINFK